MKKAVINNNTLIFSGTTKDDSIFFRQKKFKLPLSDIKVIGVKFGMLFDDDYSVIVFVSKENRRFFLGYEYFEKDTIEILNDKFNIDLVNAVSEHLEYETNQFRSEILFPYQKVGKSIFKDKNIISSIYLFFAKMFLILNYADGILSKDVKDL
ncbi:hypothetical protein [Aquimarina mytili]|uniref:Uncharacterized protein n=1 Tax=Aquimarina mytili TaxID=874423 RepID=A0A936ZYN8_9FLAO|nr:hypothetical protein [Aquimarina mytili]MBL0683581.1 hypothetical protein [Aquimarina mytili]